MKIITAHIKKACAEKRIIMEKIKKNVSNTKDETEVKEYLRKILNKEAFNKKGLIGFLGHGSPVKFRNIRIKELK